jgi:hypothetical protein
MEASAGTGVIHDTTVYKVFARWSDDGSLEQAFIASVTHLSAYNHLDLRILHGDGANTVAKKGGDGLQSRLPSRDEGDIISQPNSIERSAVDAKVPHAYNGSAHRASYRTRPRPSTRTQMRHELRPLYPGLMD